MVGDCNYRKILSLPIDNLSMMNIAGNCRLRNCSLFDQYRNNSSATGHVRGNTSPTMLMRKIASFVPPSCVVINNRQVKESLSN